MTTPLAAAMNALITAPILEDSHAGKNRQDCIYPVGIPDAFLSLFELQGDSGGGSRAELVLRRSRFRVRRQEKAEPSRTPGL
jgi:hypothetical protein